MYQPLTLFKLHTAWPRGLHLTATAISYTYHNRTKITYIIIGYTIVSITATLESPN
jgi:hypothetical protein